MGGEPGPERGRGRSRVLAVLALPAVLGIAAFTALSFGPSDAQPGPGGPAACTALLARNDPVHEPSTLSVVTFPDGASTPLGRIAYQVNAMGFAYPQGVAYGVASRNAEGAFRDGGHAVTVDVHGQVTDLGPVLRAGGHPGKTSVVTGATAGVIRGTRWYLRAGSLLYTVDIQPGSPTYLRAVGKIDLHPEELAIGVDDFDVDPVSGLLYGVSTAPHGGAAVVTIDPDTGTTAEVPGLRLPEADSYGGVVLGPDRTLYAEANDIGHHSALFRLSPDGTVAEIGEAAPVAASDLAGCLNRPAPPPPPPVSGPFTPASPPVPPAPPAPPVPPAPSVAPVVTDERPLTTPLPPVQLPPPNPSPPNPSTPRLPTPRPPTPSQPSATATKAAAATKSDQRVKQQRRWGLALLVLIIGGGAAAARVGRAR